MPGLARDLPLTTRDATLAFARGLARLLAQGDVVLLEGELGAGKSELARAMIQELSGFPIEVPSPTFTLVQTYDGPDCPITHADLYRIDDRDELEELALDEAGDLGILLVEWPGRAGPGFFPPSALAIRITALAGEQRLLQLSGDEGWAHRLTTLLDKAAGTRKGS